VAITDPPVVSPTPEQPVSVLLLPTRGLTLPGVLLLSGWGLYISPLDKQTRLSSFCSHAAHFFLNHDWSKEGRLVHFRQPYGVKGGRGRREPHGAVMGAGRVCVCV